ncbi:hypothetical protein EDD18DRAFT_1363311 [Armillaria luteobubalina]|uniref:Uncharacterized protein n=1 Tax=Armillaria luteobubalina TaxID=153913 RepID=A0AA39PCW6_9AGAR|nr:hypothetical protein EDD18DRAFT_1363311 [Armillaria luteobubalina]
MYTEESLLLEKTSGLYLTSLSHIVPLLSSIKPLSMLTLHEKLCGGFHKECVIHVRTATVDSQLVIAKIFDPLYFINPYEGMDPFPLINLSVSCKDEAYCRLAHLQGTQILWSLRLFILLLPMQGNCTVHILLLENVTGQDVHYLVPDSLIPPLCLAHCTAMVNATITVFYDILMCGVKQCNMAPCSLIICPPKHGGASFCDKGDCPVHFSIDPDNVKSVMIDFEGSELWDPDCDFYDEQTRAREMCMLREDYMEDWWYGKYRI